jgi:hypothetical protein
MIGESRRRQARRIRENADRSCEYEWFRAAHAACNKAGTNFASAWKEAVSRALQIAADRQGIKIGRDLS